MSDAISVDPEFEALCPPLAAAELAQLRANLEADGCLHPLIVWGCDGEDLLLDGHNRHRLCDELGITFKTKRLALDDRDAAKQWIITNQLGRRNLNDEQRTYLMGLLYNAKKRSDGGHGNLKKGDQLPEGQIVPPGDAADAIAEQFSVDPKTVKRAGKFAAAVEKIADAVGPGAKAEILAGKSDLTKASIARIADAETKADVRRAMKGEPPKQQERKEKAKKPEFSRSTAQRMVEEASSIIQALAKALEESEGLFSIESDRASCVSQLNIARKAVMRVMDSIKE